MATTAKQPFSARVWQTLSAINVNDHTDRKGQLTYLSWSWAWATLMEYFPESRYDFPAAVKYEDGTVEVWCELTVSDGAEALTRRMWLPVMDNRNNAVKNPDARKISDTRMRCLVKTLAMFGLGHYIYAGEDLPPSEGKDYSDLIIAVRECESLDALKKLWLGLDHDAREACSTAKDETKTRLEAQQEAA